jgi:general secretion pathway protein B
MSYILEALRKAERERQRGQAPTLATLSLTAPVRRRSWAGWIIAGLGLGNAALLAFLVTQTVLQSNPDSAPALEGKAPAPVVMESSRPNLSTPRERITVQSPRPPVAEELGERDPPAVREVRSSPELAPKLNELPASVRGNLPTLNLDIHVHSRDADKRFVVINGRRYREGERLEEGPLLETVTVDGAVLSQGRQRFQLPVR